MKLFGMVFVLLFTACGPHQVDVSGTITHKFEIDMSNLEQYFRAKCEQEAPDNVENCVNLKLAEFLEFVVN